MSSDPGTLALTANYRPKADCPVVVTKAVVKDQSGGRVLAVLVFEIETFALSAAIVIWVRDSSVG